MADYAIGDLQGCYDEFQQLLNTVNFNPSQDKLYLVGDIIARGPKSLECLNYLHQIAGSVEITLGNHDLHLLSTYHLNKTPKKNDRLDALFQSPKLAELIHFLQSQPLAIWLEHYKLLLCHAGLSPHWSLSTALKAAKQAQQQYQGDDAHYFLKNMYGSNPDTWHDELNELEKFRYTINSFTRMRFITNQNTLDFDAKGTPKNHPNLLPWFEHPNISNIKEFKIIFGHWASLLGNTSNPNVIALDTGCVWQNSLSLIELKTGVITQQAAL